MIKWLRPTQTGIIALLAIVLTGAVWLVRPAKSVAEKPLDGVTIISGETLGEVTDQTEQELIKLAQTDHIALLERCVENSHQYVDYRLTFEKQERIKGKLQDGQVTEVAFRAAPFSVGMRWLEGAGRGDRALYVEGLRDNQMLIRPVESLQWIAGKHVLRSPTHRDVMKATLRPITAFGFTNSMENLLKVYRLAEENGELTQEFGGIAEVFGRRALLLIRKLPPTHDAYEAAVTEIYIDLEYLVPVLIEGRDWQGDLVARYVFKDIRLNLGLTDEDFSPAAFEIE
jgi:hypothetical protein